MTPSVGFTFGELDSVRDRQTVLVDRSAYATTGTPSSSSGPHVLGEYSADYSALIPADLVDLGLDEEIEAMLAASIVVHRNEGV